MLVYMYTETKYTHAHTHSTQHTLTGHSGKTALRRKSQDISLGENSHSHSRASELCVFVFTGITTAAAAAAAVGEGESGEKQLLDEEALLCSHLLPPLFGSRIQLGWAVAEGGGGGGGER